MRDASSSSPSSGGISSVVSCVASVDGASSSSIPKITKKITK